jgi:polyhydroxyalkanoate synthase
VFCISWRNVDEDDRDLGFDDYRRLGIMAALDAISQIVPDQKIHATGYCLGGTLLAVAAAAMANARDERLASVTLFAAQTDFTEPGELQLFIDDSQVYFIESMMWERGYLAANQMAGSFQLLQSNDLIWSRVVHDYLLGERAPAIDLMAWNADATRMPYRMHSEYLRKLFLDNDLACARYEVDGRPVALDNIRVPMFVVGTERDHIAPWRSVYKIHYLSDTDVTFVLTSGGHNAGIVSEPGHPHRRFRLRLRAAEDLNIGPDEWLAAAAQRDGSWWPAWNEWLTAHSSGGRVAPPRIGLPDAAQPVLAAAPGTYVFQQ